MLLFARLLREELNESDDERFDDWKTYIAQVERGANRLLRQTQTWNDAYLLVNNAYPFEKKSLNVEELIDEELENIAPDLEQRQLKLISTITDLSGFCADQALFVHAIWALLHAWTAILSFDDKIELEVLASESGCKVTLTLPELEGLEKMKRRFTSVYTKEPDFDFSDGVLKPNSAGLILVNVATRALKGKVGIDQEFGKTKVWYYWPSL